MNIVANFLRALQHKPAMVVAAVTLVVAYMIHPYVFFTLLGMMSLGPLCCLVIVGRSVLRDGWEITRLEIEVAMQDAQLNELNDAAAARQRLDENRAKLSGDEYTRPSLRLVRDDDEDRKVS